MCRVSNRHVPQPNTKKDAVAYDILKEQGSIALPERGFSIDWILNHHRIRGAGFRILCATTKRKKDANASFLRL